MAVYIPKHRLGDGGGDRRERGLTQRIEAMPQYQALRSGLAQSKERAASGLKAKFDENAEVHRWRTLTPDEKVRDAVERMVPTTKQVQELRTGQECSYEDARKVAEEIAYKADRDKE